MREILFRGKRIDNGEWVYGYYVYTKDSKGKYQHFIVTPEWFIVDPTTIGQFTGLTDKNGKKIFEGDIITRTHKDYSPFDDDTTEYTDVSTEEMTWDSEFACFLYGKCPLVGMYVDIVEWEVIGNIYDNPELQHIYRDMLSIARTLRERGK